LFLFQLGRKGFLSGYIFFLGHELVAALGKMMNVMMTSTHQGQDKNMGIQIGTGKEFVNS